MSERGRYQCPLAQSSATSILIVLLLGERHTWLLSAVLMNFLSMQKQIAWRGSRSRPIVRHVVKTIPSLALSKSEAVARVSMERMKI
ncbi:MAG TPA: hypothetical protein VIG25_00560 [Pyrinomonadaceae bacterium]